MTDLFVRPPVLDPAEFGVTKTAAIRLTTPLSGWDDEVLTNFSAQYPFIPADRLMVTWKRTDESAGSGYGYIAVAGSPRVSIPVIVQDRELKPMDLLIVAAPTGDDAEGVADMQDDQVMPLTPDTFRQAMDQGVVGKPMPDHMVTGTAWSEDGSALRLPSRGRTVLAHVIPTSAAQKAALADAFKASKEAQAGFAIHGTKTAVAAWLTSPTATDAAQKFASAPELVTPRFPESVPEELSDFGGAAIVCTDGGIRAVAKVAVFDLRDPARGLAPLLISVDGTYTPAPAKVAAVAAGDAADVQAKLGSTALRRGTEVSFLLDGQASYPLKVASIAVDEKSGSIHVRLTDGLADVPVQLTRAVKQAFLEPSTGTWLMPVTTPVITLEGRAGWDAEQPDKVAKAVLAEFRDYVTFASGQFNVSVGDTKLAAVSEDRARTALELAGVQADLPLQMAKTAGLARFSFTPAATKLASPEGYRKVASAFVQRIAMPLPQALKLAASLGASEGVDAVLGAGLLTEDNLAEFTGLAPQFQETVGQLARLLLAIRMGFSGDENATMIAMKSLQRVSDALAAVPGENE